VRIGPQSLAIAILLAFASGCANRPAATVGRAPSPDPCRWGASFHGIGEISLERTGCGIGRCRSFVLTLHEDGTVEYEGRANVPFVGKRTGVLRDRRYFENVALFLSELDVFGEGMADSYGCPAFDSPTAIIRVKRLEDPRVERVPDEKFRRQRKVEHRSPYDSGPRALYWLEKAIEGAMEEVQWN